MKNGIKKKQKNQFKEKEKRENKEYLEFLRGCLSTNILYFLAIFLGLILGIKIAFNLILILSLVTMIFIIYSFIKQLNYYHKLIKGK